jgi:hypothetical protein
MALEHKCESVIGPDVQSGPLLLKVPIAVDNTLGLNEIRLRDGMAFMSCATVRENIR